MPRPDQVPVRLFNSGIALFDPEWAEWHARLVATCDAVIEERRRGSAEMRKAFEELREMLARRLDWLETTVAEHGVELERLKHGHS